MYEISYYVIDLKWFKVKNVIFFKFNKYFEGGDIKGKYKSFGWNYIV